MKKLIIISILFAGCLSSKKADKQLSRLSNKFPEKVAKKCQDNFPCFVKKIDTTFIDTIIEIDCSTVIVKRDTIIKDIIKPPKVVKVKVKVPQKVQVPIRLPQIIKYYEDSAKITVCQGEVTYLRKQLEKAKRVRSFLLGALISLLILLLLLFLMYKKK